MSLAEITYYILNFSNDEKAISMIELYWFIQNNFMLSAFVVFLIAYIGHFVIIGLFVNIKKAASWTFIITCLLCVPYTIQTSKYSSENSIHMYLEKALEFKKTNADVFETDIYKKFEVEI